MRISLKLDSKSIDKAIKRLDKYNNTLGTKCDTFCRKLGELGIKVSESNGGQYSQYLIFSCKLQSKDNTSATRIYTARKKSDVHVEWKTGSADVDPLLMAEFGSGWLADNRWSIGGVGQGTFPNQKHAKDPQGWYWVDLDGVKHHSIGELPSYPVHKAWVAMEGAIDEVIKEVFK